MILMCYNQLNKEDSAIFMNNPKTCIEILVDLW